jgi:two-component sensor histidine kinase
MTWPEKGGPLVQPPERPGFGTRMIASMVERALNAHATLSFDPAGLVWRLERDLAALTQAAMD